MRHQRRRRRAAAPWGHAKFLTRPRGVSKPTSSFYGSVTARLPSAMGTKWLDSSTISSMQAELPARPGSIDG